MTEERKAVIIAGLSNTERGIYSQLDEDQKELFFSLIEDGANGSIRRVLNVFEESIVSSVCASSLQDAIVPSTTIAQKTKKRARDDNTTHQPGPVTKKPAAITTSYNSAISSSSSALPPPLADQFNALEQALYEAPEEYIRCMRNNGVRAGQTNEESKLIEYGKQHGYDICFYTRAKIYTSAKKEESTKANEMIRGKKDDGKECYYLIKEAGNLLTSGVESPSYSNKGKIHILLGDNHYVTLKVNGKFITGKDEFIREIEEVFTRGNGDCLFNAYIQATEEQPYGYFEALPEKAFALRQQICNLLQNDWNKCKTRANGSKQIFCENSIYKSYHDKCSSLIEEDDSMVDFYRNYYLQEHNGYDDEKQLKALSIKLVNLSLVERRLRQNSAPALRASV